MVLPPGSPNVTADAVVPAGLAERGVAAGVAERDHAVGPAGLTERHGAAGAMPPGTSMAPRVRVAALRSRRDTWWPDSFWDNAAGHTDPTRRRLAALGSKYDTGRHAARAGAGFWG